MAAPAPRTWSVGEKITASLLNAELRDALAFILDPPQVIVYQTASQLMADSTTVLMTWSAELKDWAPAPMHSTSTNTSRLIAPVAGTYAVQACVGLPTSGGTRRLLMLRKNAAGSASGGTKLWTGNSTALNVTENDVHSPVIYTDLAAGEYVEVWYSQNSGGTVGVNAGYEDTFASLTWYSK
jgi:hypothetical protein